VVGGRVGRARARAATPTDGRITYESYRLPSYRWYVLRLRDLHRHYVGRRACVSFLCRVLLLVLHYGGMFYIYITHCTER
jgi:hypothetical protein